VDARQALPGTEVSLSAYLNVLRRRKWVLLVCAILVPVLAYVFTARQPAQYEASAQVYLSTEDLASALTGITPQYVDQQRLADTQATLAQTPEVAGRAIALARVKGITAYGLLGETSVASQGNTNILIITVVDHNAAWAARLATAYARAFTTYRGQLDSSSIKIARQELATKLSQLQAAGQANSSLAASLRSKDQTLATFEVLQTTRTYVIRTADGAAQIAPQPKKNAAIGLMIGIVLGLGLIVAIEALDTRVRSSKEVGDRLNMPQLARVPPPPKDLQKDDRLVMLTEPSGTSAEAFRMLRTNLEFATLDSDAVRTILVTSAVEQEGKSTTAANLALAEARAGHHVALVDLDLRVPYLDRFFDLLLAPGITDVALGSVELETALRRIDLHAGAVLPTARVAPPNNGDGAEQGLLDVLVAGPLPPDPGEFVGSRRLGEILVRLPALYDLVILDTPPLLRVGDAMTLSTYADGILVVTKLNLIRRPMLIEMERLLATAPAAKLGFVVTGRGETEEEAYGYGYGYGSGGADHRRPRPATANTTRPEPVTTRPQPAHRQRQGVTTAESALARIAELREKAHRQ
jgi:Mrp family chromosome partitioning ATPase/capsular polysaccharide biosynthesis protein